MLGQTASNGQRAPSNVSICEANPRIGWLDGTFKDPHRLARAIEEILVKFKLGGFPVRPAIAR